MDPLSITTTALTLASLVFKYSVQVRDCIEGLRDAPQSIADIADEVQTMQVALREVENTIRQDPYAIDRYDLQEVFAISVKGCHAIIMCISEEYQHLFHRVDWKGRILVLWKENDMTGLLVRLDRKKATIAMLMQALSLSA
ncbi:hypothetical protein QQX98_009052 [Neonectria punicea]|uniref:Azaphilone pigments biosynthesis cluster protein L N-terminal domain-containing protein n=1 Tax=Neonectria punicea TaxID=979145 RepID=A0ABR1GTE4_9HYPO